MVAPSPAFMAHSPAIHGFLPMHKPSVGPWQGPHRARTRMPIEAPRRLDNFGTPFLAIGRSQMSVKFPDVGPVGPLVPASMRRMSQSLNVPAHRRNAPKKMSHPIAKQSPVCLSLQPAVPLPAGSITSLSLGKPVVPLATPTEHPVGESDEEDASSTGSKSPASSKSEPSSPTLSTNSGGKHPGAVTSRQQPAAVKPQLQVSTLRQRAANKPLPSKRSLAVTAVSSPQSPGARSPAVRPAVRLSVEDMQAFCKKQVSSKAPDYHLQISLSNKTEGKAACSYKLKFGERVAEGKKLPANVGVGKHVTTDIGGNREKGVVGTVTVSGLCIRFCHSFNEGNTVMEPGFETKHSLKAAGLCRYSVTKGEATLCSEITPTGAGGAAVLQLVLRKATETETRRADALESLAEAMQGDSYTRLHAQIVKGKARGVDTIRLKEAEQHLKTLTPEGVEVDVLKAAMQWEYVTRGGEGITLDSCKNTDCGLATSVAEPSSCGDTESFDVSQGSVGAALEASALKGVLQGAEPDQWLFDRLVKAAASAPANCLWRAGGKLIMSNPDRNQAPMALMAMLMRYDPEAAGGISALIEWTKSTYKCAVTAVQVNFHLDGSSFHAQHRDIFSNAQKEKAGRDCTCSFTKCVGTCCFMVGSSRQVMCERMTDEMSPHEACGPECGGHREHHWFHSGESMYFNDAWNNGHTHGIIPAEQPCGPRISIALLCA